MIASKKLQLQEVFVLQGVPEHTFVEPTEYTQLLVALRTAGRNIVVEGPSGIGKTTAVMKALVDAGINNQVLQLSARNPNDLELIEALPQSLPIGIVLIDDFHRLNDNLKRIIADLMKLLADRSDRNSKLIVLGIPNAGASLLTFGRDLNARLEMLRLEVNPSQKIDDLIGLGEKCLNVSINIRDDIIDAAQGSFYIAQMLCYHTLIRAKILETKEITSKTEESFETVKAAVMSTLARSFQKIATSFARGARLRTEGRAPYLHLLYWLSQSADWSINVKREIDKHSQQRGSVTQVATKGYLRDFINSSSDILSVLYYDETSYTLVVQDPQFVFYLRNISWPQFSKEIGFTSLEFPSRYDFALSFSGSDRELAEALFDELSAREHEVFYDKNEQHRILAVDVEEYLAPIYASDALIVVCILGADYPKKIWTKFESDKFKPRIGSGEVVPIVIKTVPLGIFDLTSKIGYIEWDPELNTEKQLSKVADMLIAKYSEIRQNKNGSIQ